MESNETEDNIQTSNTRSPVEGRTPGTVTIGWTIHDERDANDGEGEMLRSIPSGHGRSDQHQARRLTSTPDMIYISDGGGDAGRIDLTSDDDDEAETRVNPSRADETTAEGAQHPAQCLRNLLADVPFKIAGKPPVDAPFPAPSASQSTVTVKRSSFTHSPGSNELNTWFVPGTVRACPPADSECCQTQM
ncbi:hypothetical protein MMC13_007437 [Lambiella insularis]|nr:hypothetical protein [Lambiella insularis]